jgi:NAD(P)-dependent dehydrogenase (short-subunit alcohol dehydrogenase family)
MPPEISPTGKMQGLAGRVAVVTGASRNIGRSLALGFAEHGAKVVVADLDLDQATAVAGQIEAAGGEALPLRVDISDRDRVSGMADAIRSRFGRFALQ